MRLYFFKYGERRVQEFDSPVVDIATHRFVISVRTTGILIKQKTKDGWEPVKSIKMNLRKE